MYLIILPCHSSGLVSHESQQDLEFTVCAYLMTCQTTFWLCKETMQTTKSESQWRCSVHAWQINLQWLILLSHLYFLVIYQSTHWVTALSEWHFYTTVWSKQLQPVNNFYTYILTDTVNCTIPQFIKFKLVYLSSYLKLVVLTELSHLCGSSCLNFCGSSRQNILTRDRAITNTTLIFFNTTVV